MGFDIPEPFVWDESFKVFYAELDEEHKGLFQGVFSVAKTPADAGALSHLAKLVDDHFKHEEQLMKAKSYADYDSHKKAHDDFLATLKTISSPVAADKVHFAKDWLVNHIKGTDFGYKGKL
uniref:Putative myohemerythrin-like protein n=1 Tax=Haementeria vizottoi TaxID=1628691 RepID=A0A0P4W5Q6_9ANNE